MKILKPGVIPQDFVYRFECGVCGCQAEAAKNEGQPAAVGTAMLGTQIWEFNCPCCLSNVQVGADQARPPVPEEGPELDQKKLGRWTIDEGAIPVVEEGPELDQVRRPPKGLGRS